MSNAPRLDLVAHVREQIDSGTYVTKGKLMIVVDKLVEQELSEPGPSLNEALSRHGLTTRRRGSAVKEILRDGEVIFAGRAGEVWSWLRGHGWIR